MEERIITLEKRYVRSQNELTSSSENNERTQTKLKSFLLTIAQVCRDRVSAIQLINCYSLG